MTTTIQKISDLAFNTDQDGEAFAELEEMSTLDLVASLETIAKDHRSGELAMLYAVETVLVILDLRSDVDPKSRRMIARLHKGILEQIDQLV